MTCRHCGASMTDKGHVLALLDEHHKAVASDER